MTVSHGLRVASTARASTINETTDQRTLICETVTARGGVRGERASPSTFLPRLPPLIYVEVCMGVASEAGRNKDRAKPSPRAEVRAGSATARAGTAGPGAGGKYLIISALSYNPPYKTPHNKNREA